MIDPNIMLIIVMSLPILLFLNTLNLAHSIMIKSVYQTAFSSGVCVVVMFAILLRLS